MKTGNRRMAVRAVLAMLVAGPPCRAALVPFAPTLPSGSEGYAAFQAKTRLGLDATDTFIERAAATAVAQSVGSLPGYGDTGGTISGTEQDTCVIADGVATLMAPDTPREYVNYLKSLSTTTGVTPHFVALHNWTSTATNKTVSPGDPITLTYSFVPDGTTIGANQNIHPNEATGPSNLYAVLNFQFFTADPNVWKAKFRDAFNAWGAVLGVKYVEVSDDGAQMGVGGSPGELGKRGDIRIGGHYIDGGGNVLAYCYLPSGNGSDGDMVLDCDNNPFHAGDYWATVDNNYQRIHYVVAHEHGHGLGLDHTQPLDHTKLMEPIVNDNFSNPQDDDIRGGESLYGDFLEKNDTPATATALGAVRGYVIVRNVSISSVGDEDWYRIDLTGASHLNVLVRPVGSTYLVAPYDSNNPTYGVSTNTAAQMLLGVDVYGADGATSLASGTAPSLGQPVSLNNVSIPVSSKSCYVQVHGESSSSVQRYELVIYQYYSALYVDIKAQGYMDGTPQYPYDSVQTAINAATPSIDTIFIRAATYGVNFPSGINKPLTLIDTDPIPVTLVYHQ